jgi:hypothetical protein
MSVLRQNCANGTTRIMLRRRNMVLNVLFLNGKKDGLS